MGPMQNVYLLARDIDYNHKVKVIARNKQILWQL